MTLLTIEDNELRLNTNLDEYTFGKTAHDAVLSQEGVIFDGKNFRQWTFEEVKSYDVTKNGSTERLVFYCMSNPLSSNAKTLAEFFQQSGEAALSATLAVCAALTSAAKNGNTIPFVGAGGILVDNDKVLFAPQTLFSYAANTLPAAEALNQNTGFLNETINGLPAICFERAAIVYRLLSGQLPFTATDSITRNADILDQKFLPLEYCINKIDSELAFAVNNALKLSSTAVNVPGKKKKGKSSDELKPQEEFPIEKLTQAFELSQSQLRNGSDKDFQEKVTAYLKSQNSKITTKRNLKRNATTISVIAAVVVIALCVTINTIKSRGDDYTSVGLTANQTIRAYMNAVNNKDTMLLSDFGSGKTPGDFGDMVSRIYVMHKQRLAYGGDNGFAYPSNWLFFITDASKYAHSGIYGITNLKIDGKAEELAVELHKKNEKVPPLTKEGNVTLQNGSTSIHKLEYYLIYTEGDVVDFIVEKYTTTITLTYTKNRWLVTDLQQQGTDLKTDCEAFKRDYFAAVSENNGDVIKATDSLRTKYEWLPEQDAMQREKDRIDYELAHPYAILGF